jgi:two-component system sensor histidine kinase KdpD
VREEAGHLTRRVRDLLDMTRLEAGAVALEVEWQSLEEVVGAALPRVEHGRGERRISAVVPPGLPLVRCDGALLEQVVVNLLENALKYAAGSPIEVSGEATAEEVVLSVVDRGPGIPAGAEEKLFEKFYRVSTGKTAGGVGLGLAICRAIVAAHGGRIWAENREGGGAAFRVALPRQDPPPESPPEELPA